MSEFWVNISELRAAAAEIEAVAQSLEPEIAEISGVGSEAGGSCAANIDNQLRFLSEELMKQKREIESMSSTLFGIADVYEATEKNVVVSVGKYKKDKGKGFVKNCSESVQGTTGLSFMESMKELDEALGIIGRKSDFKKHICKPLQSKLQYVKYTVLGQQKTDEYTFEKTDAKDNNDSPMGIQFGFSTEEEEMLGTAYKRYSLLADYLGWDNRKKIYIFFGCLAALNPEYSADRIHFKLLAGSPSTESAILFFNMFGMDGEAMKEMLNNQHSLAPNLDIRDFAHECATITVTASRTPFKLLASRFENVDAMAGYKGDIYSTQMDYDDIKSDIASVNLYNRMINCKNGDIWGAFLDYNEGVSNGTINESLEFLNNYGDGDPVKGFVNLIKEMVEPTAMTDVMFVYKGLENRINLQTPSINSLSDVDDYLESILESITKGVEEAGKEVDICKKIFLKYIIEQVREGIR